MINNSPKESDFPFKLEDGHHNSSDHEKAKAPSSSSSSLSSQWLKLKDPRIVRVSRAFGGKDRHSKVCTIKGLRDRRVRLSVPTAIHLYDLQDKLGLNQPSKVVDWLLNAAKHEIDELPPLPIPPSGNFMTLGSYNYPSLVPNSNELGSTTSHWELDNSCQNSSTILKKSKPKEVSEENWVNRGDDDIKPGAHVLPNHSSFLGLLSTMPLVGYQVEPNSSSDVDQLGNHGGFTNRTDMQSINVVPFPSTLSLSNRGATQSCFFPSSHVAAMDMDHLREMNNHHQMLSSSSSQNLLTNSLSASQYHHMSHRGKPFSLALNMTPKFYHYNNSGEIQSHKDQDFPSKRYTHK